MKTKVVNQKDGVEIRVSEAAPHINEFVAAFEDCREGRCSCPTQEYEKVDSLSIKEIEDGIVLSVKAKHGRNIDTGEIEKCLEHTKNRIK